MAYTADELINSIKRRSFAPTGQITVTETEMLSIADEETQTEILPEIESIRQGYFTFVAEIPLVANQQAYALPARAMGMVARDCVIVDGSNNVKKLKQIEHEDVTTFTAGTPSGFWIQGNDIMIDRAPASVSGEILRVPFPLSPGQLQIVSSAAVISAIDTTTNVVSVTTIPSTWATGNSFDFIKKDGGHNYVAVDKTSVLVSGTDISFSDLPSSLAVGDYVSLAGYSPLVQLPPNFRAVLAQCTAAQILESMSQPGAERARKKAREMIAAGLKLIAPRVTNETRIIENLWVD